MVIFMDFAIGLTPLSRPDFGLWSNDGLVGMAYEPWYELTPLQLQKEKRLKTLYIAHDGHYIGSTKQTGLLAWEVYLECSARRYFITTCSQHDYTHSSCCTLFLVNLSFRTFYV